MGKAVPCCGVKISLKGVRGSLSVALLGSAAGVEVFVECDAFHFEEACADGLYRAEAGGECVAHALDVAAGDHPLQFGHAKAADVVVNVIEALTPDTLQDEVTVQTDLLTQTVAAERAVFPLLVMLLHPVVDDFEAAQVCLVEVLLFLLLVLLGRFRHFLDDGPRQLQRDGFQRAKHEVEVQEGKQDDVDGQQSPVVEYGDVCVEDYGEPHRHAVSQQVSRHVGVSGHSARQHEDVGDVVDAEAEGAEPHQDVAAQHFPGQFLRRVDIDDTASHQRCDEIDADEHQYGPCVAPHALPLQEARHRDVQRVDALQVTRAEHGQQHCRMQDSRLANGDVVAEERRREQCAEENPVDPSQAQILYPVTRKKTHHAGYHEMDHGGTCERHEKYVFAHAVFAFSTAKLSLFV